jgi:hypothetical protein
MRFLILGCLIIAESLFAQWTLHFADEKVGVIHAQGGSLFVPIYENTLRSFFYRSDDDGVSWDSLGGGVWAYIQEMQNLGDTLWASSHWYCRDTCDGPALFRSSARGSGRWEVILEWYGGVTNLVAHNNIIFINVGEFYKSVDGGASWTVFNTAPSPLDLVSLDGVLYSKGLYKSTDDGNTWTSIRSNLFTTSVYDIQKNESFLFACKDSVYRSADGGQSWEPINSGLPLGPRLRYHYLTVEDSYVAVSNNDNVYLSANNGEQWTDVSEGLSLLRSDNIYRILIRNNYLFVTTNKGIWRRHVSELVSVKEGNGHLDPASYRLEQNYPNPFNPETVIKYHIPHSAHVKVAIFNLLGMKVRTLFDSFQKAGEHSAVWDAKDDEGNSAASGIYFYRLETGEMKLQKKMVLVR